MPDKTGHAVPDKTGHAVAKCSCAHGVSPKACRADAHRPRGWGCCKIAAIYKVWCSGHTVGAHISRISCILQRPLCMSRPSAAEQIISHDQTCNDKDQCGQGHRYEQKGGHPTTKTKQHQSIYPLHRLPLLYLPYGISYAGSPKTIPSRRSFPPLP